MAATIPQVLEIRKGFPLPFVSCYRLGLLCVRKEGVRVGRTRVSHMRRAEVLNAQGLEQAIPFAHPRAALLKDFDPALEGMSLFGGTGLEGVKAVDGGLQGLNLGVKAKKEISRKVHRGGWRGKARHKGKGAGARANDGNVEARHDGGMGLSVRRVECLSEARHGD